MDCLIAIKRPPIKNHQEEGEQYTPTNKRFCSGLESCLSIQNGHMYSHLNNSQTEPAGGSVLKSLGESPGLVINHERGDIIQPCSRCMAGESGHINHIMGI
ncbi:uncharacterized protein SI:CH211-221J21.3 isoform X2 [Latimeria chalumnae]|uniref:uncharacterized protein SI:CH211-221J21.3 isoform X2 n=1 Tax=Latimeria chalumnae TaxID=7897 RepID=UPI0006D8EF78|nr:PREDICTED: uncharacterized protein LOC106706268 [Latimeria chalumnae]|eukprot:XP_014352409.1 PREDICTED: uncharacterized protein LOC106706268 [Latimeria chalumnae]